MKKIQKTNCSICCNESVTLPFMKKELIKSHEVEGSNYKMLRGKKPVPHHPTVL